MDNNQAEEKYKATKLWNDAIRAFRNQMPVKQHRKNFKLFADTFTGTEAVDWLHGYLSAKAGTANNDALENTKKPPPILNKVTREQTLALVNKFFDHGLFEPARVKGPEKSVKDDGTLFKFSNLSPSKIAWTPLALKNNSRTDVHAVNGGDKTPTRKTFFNGRPTRAVTPISYRKITSSDSEKANGAEETKSNLLTKLEQFSMIDDLLAMDDLNGYTARDEYSAPSTAFSSRQNSIRSKNDKIRPELLVERQNNLPPLQFVARQLSLEEMENVWKTLALSNLRQLLRLDDQAFDGLLFILGRDICHNSKQLTARGVTRVFSKLDDLPSWTLQAMKCLANWPWKNAELNWPCYPGFERDVFATVLDFFATQSTPLIPYELQELMLEVLNRVEYLDVQQWDANHEELTLSPSVRPKAIVNLADDDISIETEFGPRSPITRLVEREQSRSLPSSTSSALTDKKQDEILAGLRSELEANVRSLEEILSTLPGLVKSPRLLREIRELRTKNGKQIQQYDFQKGDHDQLHHLRASPVLDRDVAANPMGHFDGKVLSSFLALPGARFSVASTLTGSFEFSGSPPPITQSSNGTSLSFFTRTGRQTACQALQLCLLFLPPKNRRWVQLLLRMMSKICFNYCLRLDKHNAVSNRSIVLEAFCDVIVTGNRDGGMVTMTNLGTRQQRMKLVSFLLDAVNEVFAAPTDLIANVDTRVRQMQRAKICYNLSGQNPTSLTINTADDQLTYCDRISPKEYEQQAAFSSRHALEKLMDSIADDKTLSGAEKKKRLKKFKDSYPDLFEQRFPNKASFDSLIKTSNSNLNKANGKLGGSFGKIKL